MNVHHSKSKSYTTQIFGSLSGMLTVLYTDLWDKQMMVTMTGGNALKSHKGPSAANIFLNFYKRNAYPKVFMHSHKDAGPLFILFIFSVIVIASSFPCIFRTAARFSPDDKYSRQRVLLKKRFGLLPTQQPPQKY